MILPEFCEELFYVKEINLFETNFKNYLQKVLDYNFLEIQKYIHKYNNYTIIEIKLLKHFDISSCELTKIPSLNFNHNNIERLNFNHNKLKSFPNLNLPNLQSLHLFNNQLTSISLNFPNLRNLDLGNNELTSVSLDLPNLKALHLDNNMLTSILNITLDVPKLELLFIYNNPLPKTEKDKLKSICDKVYL